MSEKKTHSAMNYNKFKPTKSTYLPHTFSFRTSTQQSKSNQKEGE